MRQWIKDSRGWRARPWSVALAVSLIVHFVVLMAMFWRQDGPAASGDPAIEVRLFDPPPVPPVSSAVASPALRPHRTPLRVAPPAPPVMAPSVVIPPASAPPPGAPTESARALALRQALRGSAGCAHAALLGLSESERRRCRERQAHGLEPKPGQGGFGMDPDKRAAFAAEGKAREPFLIQTPKNNCVPRVAQKEVGMAAGATHDWTAGINCALSF